MLANRSSNEINPFLGNYGPGADIIMRDGQLVVTTNDGRVSPATFSGNNIDVKFLNDTGCCTGIFSNGRINWSNGATWTKTN